MNGDKETWFEAKSGNFWNDPVRIQKFRTNAGQQAQIAEVSGVRFEVHSNSPIPADVKTWLTNRGIPFVEW